MPKLLLLLLFAVSGLLFPSHQLLAQQVQVAETVASQIARLKYRYEIDDFDGIGELIEPLFNQVIGKEESSLDLPQKHLVAMAAMRFHLVSGDHSRAILPYLLALHLQTELKEQPHHLLLVEPADKTEKFRRCLPTLFFTADDRSRFRKQFDQAVTNGVCLKTELSEAYYKAGKDQRSPAQQKILDAILLVRENPQPTDREIHKLLDHSFDQWVAHPTLTREAMTTAIEGLMKLNRAAEADRLKSTLFPKRIRYLGRKP